MRYKNLYYRHPKRHKGIVIQPNVSREAFRDSSNSLSRLVAIEASSVFRCKT